MPFVVWNSANAGHIKKRKIKKLFKHSQIVHDHFTGFVLYDMDNKRMVYGLNADKYFIPASNAKLFTFYTCLKILGDSIPSIKYIIRQYSLIFWGTGDPSFLYNELSGVNAFNFLKGSDKKLFFSAGEYSDSFWVHGWAWDDYNDYYQTEINELPIAGNTAVIYADNTGQLKITPSYLTKYLQCDPNYKPATFKVQRDYADNTFVYPDMQYHQVSARIYPLKQIQNLHSTYLQIR